MLNPRLILLSTLFLLVVQSNTQPCQASPFRADLSETQSYSDVLQLWGAPISKESKETLREDLWYYAGGVMVIFKEGEVSTWANTRQSEAMFDRAIQITPKLPIGNKLIDELLNEMANAGEAEDQPGSEKNAPPPPPAPIFHQLPASNGLPDAFTNGLPR